MENSGGAASRYPHGQNGKTWVFSYSENLRMIDDADNELISQLPVLKFLLLMPAEHPQYPDTVLQCNKQILTLSAEHLGVKLTAGSSAGPNIDT